MLDSGEQHHDLYMHYEMISMMCLYILSFSSLWWEFIRSILSVAFKIYNTVLLLTLSIMPMTYLYYNWKLVAFDHLHPFSPTNPISDNHEYVPCISEFNLCRCVWGFPSDSVVKNPPAMQKLQEDRVQSGEGNGNPLQYSAWRILWTEEAGELQSTELQKVGHNWNDLACVHFRLHV